MAIAVEPAVVGGRRARPASRRPSVQALTKVIALMPPRLRRQMDALRVRRPSGCRGAAARPSTPALLSHAGAGLPRRRADPLHLHRPRGASRPTAGSSRTGWCRWAAAGTSSPTTATGRTGARFRVDRINEPRTSGQTFRPRELPADDACRFVQAGIRRMPQRYAVRVVIDADPAEVAAVAGRWADGHRGRRDGAVLEMNVDSLDWPMFMLANLDADFDVESPRSWPRPPGRTAARFVRSLADG